MVRYYQTGTVFDQHQFYMYLNKYGQT